MNTNTPQAGFWRRLIAFLLDGAIGFLLFLPVFMGLGNSKTIPEFIYYLFIFILFVFGFQMVISSVYDVLMTYYLYGTFGKLLTGIHVVDEQQKRLRFRRVMFRYFIGYIFSTLVFGLGYWSIITDKNKQAWHDKIVGSYVIAKQKYLWLLALLLLMLIVTFEGMFLLQQFTTFIQGPVVKQIQKNIAENEMYEKTKKQQEKIANNNPQNLVNKAYSERLDRIGLLLTNKKFDQAQRETAALEKITKTKEEQSLLANTKGMISIYTGQYEEGEEYFTQAIEFYSRFSAAYANRSLVRVQLRKNAAALADAKKAVGFTPDLGFAHYALGTALYANGQDTEAITELQKAINLEPANKTYKEVLQQIVEASPTPIISLTPSKTPSTTTFGYDVSPQTINITVPAGECFRAFTAKYTGTGANSFRLSPYTVGDPAIHWDSTEYVMDRPMPAFVGMCVDSSFTNHNETRSATVTFLDRNSGKSIPLSVTVNVP